MDSTMDTACLAVSILLGMWRLDFYPISKKTMDSACSLSNSLEEFKNLAYGRYRASSILQS
jgi:hypothetical protein